MNILKFKPILLLIFILSIQMITAQAGAPKVLQESDSLVRLKKIRSQSETPSRWLKESQWLWLLGAQTGEKKKKLTYYEEGAQLDEKVLRGNPTDPGALLWLAANLGGIASSKKNFSSLRTISQIEKILLKLKKLDPDFHFRAADRALGRIYLEAPSFFSIGSNKKAQEHLTEALSKFPDFAGNQIAYAWLLFKNNDKRKARELALSVLNSSQLEIYPIDGFGDWYSVATTIRDQTEEKGP